MVVNERLSTLQTHNIPYYCIIDLSPNPDNSSFWSLTQHVERISFLTYHFFMNNGTVKEIYLHRLLTTLGMFFHCLRISYQPNHRLFRPLLSTVHHLAWKWSTAKPLLTIILVEGGVLFSFRALLGRKLKRKFPKGKFLYTRWVSEGLWRGSDESFSNVKMLRHYSQ